MHLKVMASRVRDDGNELHEILARAQLLIRTADIELNEQYSSRRGAKPSTRMNATVENVVLQPMLDLGYVNKIKSADISVDSVALQPTMDSGDSKTVVQSADDSTVFLLDMQRKLENPDFKRIFDDTRVKGLKGYEG